MELMQAHTQWSSRAEDERFLSLNEMADHFNTLRENSKEIVLASNKINAVPLGDPQHKGMALEVNGNAMPIAPTHWAFGQLAARAEAPASYLRTLPAPVAADCINYGLQFKRSIEDVGIFLQRTGPQSGLLRAATGPKYGRVWNADIIAGLIDRFGDGVTGRFRVPGEWGKAVTVNRDNTTLFASDEDCFVFLADESNRIEVPNRRNGQPGTMARGFFVWNSEVGAQTFGVATFLFDYVCGNRIVWGADGYKEIRIRHTASAPERWIHEVAPALETYANSQTADITKALADAREKKLGDKLDDFLAQRFGKRVGEKIKLAHLADEGRPMENLWDVITGATAFARSIQNSNDRVLIERKAGDLFAEAA
jgi:hypothetical protein